MEIAAEVWSWTGPKATGTARWSTVFRFSEAHPALRAWGGGDVLVPFLLLPLAAGAVMGAVLGWAQALTIRTSSGAQRGWTAASTVAGMLALPMVWIALYAVAVSADAEARRGNRESTQLGVLVVAGAGGVLYALLTSIAVPVLTWHGRSDDTRR